MVYLDACVFLGLDSPVLRERINALVRILRIHGETWPLSKTVADDVQAVMDKYLVLGDYPSSHSSSSDSDAWNGAVVDVAGNAPFLEPFTMGFDAYSDFDLVQGGLFTDGWPDIPNTYQF